MVLSLPWLLALQTTPTFEAEALVLEGDAITGVGAVTRIDNITVQNGGQWFVEADTDEPNTDADQVLLSGGALVLQESQALLEPNGTTLDSFDSIQLDDLGRTSFNHFLDGAVTSSDDSGIFSGDTLLIRESDPAPPFFSPLATYAGFFETKRSGGDHILVLATIDDPLLSTGLDRGIIRLEVDANDNILATESIVKTGDLLSGQTELVDDVLTNPHSLAMNRAGDVIYVANLEGDTTLDHAVVVFGVVVAQEGFPSPIPGRNWELLSSAKVDLNNAGQFAFSGNLDGDTANDNIIFSSNGVVAREGDEPPGGVAPGEAFTSFGSGPVLINDRGEVLWFGTWGSGTGALFLDETPLLVQGTSQVNGQTVTQLRGIQDGYTMSTSGGYVLVEAILADGTEGAFLLTRNAGSQVLPDCSGTNPATLVASAPPSLGTTIDLLAGDSTYPLAVGVVTLSAGVLTPALLPCGTPLPGLGEVFVDPGPGLLLLNLPTFSGTPVSTSITIPNQPTLAGVRLYGQAAFVDVSVPIPSLELSDGLLLELGG